MSNTKPQTDHEPLSRTERIQVYGVILAAFAVGLFLAMRFDFILGIIPKHGTLASIVIAAILVPIFIAGSLRLRNPKHIPFYNKEKK